MKLGEGIILTITPTPSCLRRNLSASPRSIQFDVNYLNKKLKKIRNAQKSEKNGNFTIWRLLKSRGNINIREGRCYLSEKCFNVESNFRTRFYKHNFQFFGFCFPFFKRNSSKNHPK